MLRSSTNLLVKKFCKSLSFTAGNFEAERCVTSRYNQLQTYVPPSWARNIRHQPSKYVELALRPTPIHHWNLPQVPTGFQVSIKRDDMTGSTLSGNKVRKLEFLLAEALQKNCDAIIACGGTQSNCARASAMAARQLGLHPHLILGMEGGAKVSALGHAGNILLNKIVGSTIVLVNSFDEDGGSIAELEVQMEKYRQTLVNLGLNPYVIPLGGFLPLGTWGYIEAFNELMKQGLHDRFDDIVIPVGSGGSLCGLGIANYLTGSRLRIHGVCAYENASYFHEHIDHQLEEFGLTKKSPHKRMAASSRDLVDIIDGYVGNGYGHYSVTELDSLQEIMHATGVCLDHFYNLKGVTGMLNEMQCNPSRYSGSRVLYLHTGGIFCLYDGVLDNVIKSSAHMNQVYDFNSTF